MWATPDALNLILAALITGSGRSMPSSSQNADRAFAIAAVRDLAAGAVRPPLGLTPLPRAS